MMNFYDIWKKMKQVHQHNENKASYTDMKRFIEVNKLFLDFYESDTIQKFSSEIMENFLNNYKNPRNFDMEKNKPTPIDLHTSPFNISDDSLEIVAALLGNRTEHLHKDELTELGLDKLSHILQKAYKNFVKDTHMHIEKDLDSWKNERGEITIRNTQDYKDLLFYLSGNNRITDNTISINKTPKQRVQHCSFLKFIYITAHIDANQLMAMKESVFRKIVENIFEQPFFIQEHIPIFYENHEVKIGHQNVGHTGDISTNEKKYKVHIDGRAKSEKSISDKMITDYAYNNITAFNDIFGFRITAQTHQELTEIFAHFLEVIPSINAGGIQFNHKKNIDIKDKNMLYSHNKNHEQNTNILIENIPPKYKEILGNLQKREETNGKNAKSYKECKILIPIKTDGIPFSIEVQFVLKDNENEKGIANHKVYEIRRKLKKIYREQKFLTKYDIISTIENTIEENPYLIESIGNGSKETTRDLIIHEFFLEENFLQERVIMDKNGVKKSFFVITDMVKVLEKFGYYPKTNEIESTILTPKRVKELLKNNI